MIPMKRFTFEKQGGEYGEYHQRNDFLNNLELDERERSAIASETDTIGWYLKGIFGKSNAPRKQDDKIEWPTGYDFHLLQLEVAVPGKCHKDIRNDEEEYSI
jgi:hypothetical protein